MNCVYILQSEKNGRYYIGSTNDLNRRIVEHNMGKTKSLKYLLPMKIVFSQTCDTLKNARNLEYRLKKAKSKTIIEKIIADGVIKMGL